MNFETIPSKFNRHMKKIFLLLSFGLLSCAGLMAQPMFIISNATACQGESFTVDVRVQNFTDIYLMDIQFLWDQTIIQYQGVEMIHPTLALRGLDLGDFDTSNTINGVLSLDWATSANCTQVTPADGVTLDDCLGQCRPTIFKLRFTMLSATYGETTEVTIGNFPYVARASVLPCANTGLIKTPGLVSNCVRPVELIAAQRQGNPGDLVCVDFKVTGFDDLNSMQFTINYNPAVLNYESIVIPGVLTNLSQANFGTAPNLPEGTITLSWLYTTPQNTGITILDSTTIFQICFRIVGDCETASLITFGNDPTPIEIGNTIVQNFNIHVLPRSGRVQVSDCNPTGMPLIVNCGPPVNLGDTFCVEVTSNGFFNVATFSYLMEWNPAILEFVNITNVTTNGISNFSLANFNTSNQQAGILGVSWERTGVNNAFIPNGVVHYRVCFRVVGVGSNSPVSLTGPVPVVRVGGINSPNIGINPTNCEVVVNQPSGVIMNVSSASAELGNQACVDISVSNFTNITKYQFSLSWDPAHLQYNIATSLQNVMPPLSPLLNFNPAGAASGTLTFSWNPAMAQTRPDGTVLFRVCFTVIGDPGDCELVSVSDIPVIREAVTSFSNGNNVGIASTDGEICSLFPEGFFLSVGSANAFYFDTICVPFKVASFDNITEARFEVSFNPNQLEYIGFGNLASLPGLSASSFNVTQAGLGSIVFTWTNFTGSMLPDSTVLFELCFIANGEAGGACHNIEIIREPRPTVLTTQGVGSLVWRNGRICVADKIILVEALITPVSCPGANDGAIELVVTGGRPPYGSIWQSVPPQFTPLMARNLGEGPIIVTIYDLGQVPSITRIDTFYIPLSLDAPTADAGPDFFFPCDGTPIAAIQGQGTDGPDYTYQWTTLNGQISGAGNTELGLAASPGFYIFSVTNTVSECTVRDTVEIFQPDFPTADAGAIQLTTCLSDTVTLDGSLSSVGDTVAYSWTALSGGAIVAGDATLASPRVVGVGTYVLEVRYTSTGCVARDTVTVNDGAVPPTAVAGSDAVIGCDATLTLDGSASFGVNALNFRWESPTTAVLSNIVTYETGDPGVYILVVTDQINGCEHRDTVSVSLTGELPLINAGADLEITCNDAEVTFQGTVSNSTSFSVQWTPLDGGAIVPGTETSLNARSSVPGTYLMRVVDQFTNCVATDTLTITDNAVLPDLIFNQPDTLTCDSTSITLSATVSTGAGIANRWFFGGAQVATNVNFFTATAPGFYTVEVENTLTGCISTDSIEVFVNLSAPTLGIVPPLAWSCLLDTIPLAGSIVTGNVPGVVIWWVAADGTNSNILGDSSLSPVVLAPGTYTMRAANPFTGCIGEATVTVEADSISPTALAGADRLIGCDGAGILLDGNGASGSINAVSFAWIGPGGGVIANADTVTISDPGIYVFRVTDQVNGCSTTDSLQVSFNDEVPVANIAPAELRLDCTEDQLTIPGEVTFAGNFTFTWEAFFGGQLIAGTETSLTPQTVNAGIYVLTVLNPANMCSTSDTVTVIVERDPPNALSSQDFTLTCEYPSIVIQSTGSATGSNIVYSWYLDNPGNLLATGIDSIVATDAGVYILEVVNTETGCSALDTTIITRGDTPPQITLLTPTEDLTINCSDGEVTATIEITSPNASLTIEWGITGPGGNIVSISTDSLTITVNEPGFYEVIVTDSVSSCTASYIVEVVLDADVPTVSIEPDTMRLDCSTDVLTLPGQITSGGGFTFEWQVLAGGQLVAGTETSQTPQTGTAGLYILIATNTASLCTASDTVAVIVDRDLPTAVSSPNDTLTCADPSFKLESTGSSVGDLIVYNWYRTNLDTLIAPGADAHIVTTPGTYILQVINTENGCTATDTTVLILNGVQPMVSVLTQSIELFITCDNTEVTAEIGITPFSTDLIIEWSITGPTGHFVSIAPDSLSITVDQPGIYTVRVTDPVNGCVGINEVVVELDTDLPTVVVNSPQGTEINCTTSVIPLNGTGSSSGPDFSYQWNAIALGSPPVVITPLQVTVNTPGVYELVVTDNANGCVSRRTVTITQNISNPVATIAQPGDINCNITIVSLNGDGSTIGANFTATWNSLDGGPISPTGNPLQVNVSAAGRYELVIRDVSNGCEARDTATVTANVAPPVANAGADRNINCNGTNVTLDGSASTPAGGVTFLWSAISGGGPINGTTIAMPVVNTAGTYQLIVTDTQTGCRDTATVIVTVVNTLEDAFAGENFRVCSGDPVSLSANLPAGATGLWSSTGSLTFSSPNTGQTGVNNLQAGANTVIWTLSTAQCLNYSADTLTVTVQAAPQAGNDLINIPTGEFTATTNILANDMLFGATAFSVSIISGPTLGRVDTLLDGILRYSVAPGVFGQDQIRYQICNTECPGLCDTAFIQINIEQTVIEYSRPNAITPNGDGLNDELIFDQLLNTPDLYPNHELIIFNRWNDIVFRASPYLNNWRGTNQSGQDLPQGTYYYILRLNVAEGEIIRGDITILK